MPDLGLCMDVAMGFLSPVSKSRVTFEDEAFNTERPKTTVFACQEPNQKLLVRIERRSLRLIGSQLRYQASKLRLGDNTEVSFPVEFDCNGIVFFMIKHAKGR